MAVAILLPLACQLAKGGAKRSVAVTWLVACLTRHVANKPAKAARQIATSLLLAFSCGPLAGDDAPLIHPFLDGERGRIPGSDAEAALAGVDAPNVAIERITPSRPRVGDQLEIFVTGKSPLGVGVRLEYRPHSEADWQLIDGDRIALPALREGQISVQFRAVDAKGRSSQVLDRSWRVAVGKRPRLFIDSVSPTYPNIGDTLVVKLASDMVDRDMVYEYRRKGRELWQQSKDGVIEIALVSGGQLIMEFRCSGSTRQLSEVVGHAWDIASDAPVVNVERFAPSEPSTGDELNIFVTGKSPLGTDIRLEYRPRSEAEWQVIDGGRITLPDLREGPISMQFRAVDTEGRYSPVLVKSWHIAPGRQPKLHIDSVSPESPFAGDTLEIKLASDVIDREMVFAYRRVSNGLWQPAKDGVIKIDRLSRGKLSLEFRCIGGTRQFSEVVSRSWDVSSRCDIPLDVSADIAPDEPLIGGRLTFHLTSGRPSPRLTYQYRIAPNPEWCNSAETSLTVDDLEQGQFIAQFRVADQLCNDIATSSIYRIGVEKNRFEVTGLTAEDGRLTAEVLDHLTGDTSQVGVSDEVGERSVVAILLPQKHLIVSSPNRGYERIPIPSQHIDDFRKHRLVTPRTTARGAAHRGKSERYITDRSR